MPRLSSKDENVFGGSWSVKKLECIQEYIESYLNVFKKQKWTELWYIEAFSGDGKQGIRDAYNETVEFIDGSSARVMSIAAKRLKNNEKTFSHFVFIELDKSKTDSLKATIKDTYPELFDKCVFINEDANRALPQLLKSINWVKSRAVSFVDPCATQLNWTTLKAFSGTCVDVWYLFPISAVARLLPKKNLPDDTWSKCLDRIFGEDNWRNLYYDPTIIQPQLFVTEEDQNVRNPGIQEILNYAEDRFRMIFPCVVQPAILKSNTNSPLFALYPLIANDSTKAQEAAKRIATHIVKKLNGPT